MDEKNIFLTQQERDIVDDRIGKKKIIQDIEEYDETLNARK